MLAILFSQKFHVYPLISNVPLTGLQERPNGIGIRAVWVGLDYKHPVEGLSVFEGLLPSGIGK
jgi:hypothetical protein